MTLKNKEVLNKKEIVIIKKKDLFKHITNNYENSESLNEINNKIKNTQIPEKKDEEKYFIK